MSSDSKKKKLAIISSHNTARSLKFAERPNPVSRNKYDKIMGKVSSSKHKTNRPMQSPQQPAPLGISSPTSPLPHLVVPSHLKEEYESGTSSIMSGIQSPGLSDFSYPLISGAATVTDHTLSSPGGSRGGSSIRTASRASSYSNDGKSPPAGVVLLDTTIDQQQAHVLSTQQLQSVANSTPSPSTEYLNTHFNSDQLTSHRIAAPTPIDPAHRYSHRPPQDLTQHAATIPARLPPPSPSPPVYLRSFSESALFANLQNDQKLLSLTNQSVSDPAVHFDSSNVYKNVKESPSRCSVLTKNSNSGSVGPLETNRPSSLVTLPAIVNPVRNNSTDHQDRGSTSPLIATMNEKSKDETISVAEFLALSNGPVSLDDFHIGGERITLRSRQENSSRNITTRRPAHSPLTSAKSPTFTTLPHTVHQFCVHSSLPLLPLELQILSQKVHAHPSDREWSTVVKQPNKTTEKDQEMKTKKSKESELEVLGVTLPIETDPMKLLWVPAPGKLALYPSTVQQLLTTNRNITTDDAPDSLEAETREQYTSSPLATMELMEDKHLREVKELQRRQLLESSRETSQVNEQALDSEVTVLGMADPNSAVNSEHQINQLSIDSHAQYLFVMNEVAWQREQLIQHHKDKMEAASESKEEQHHEEREIDEDTIVSGSLASQLDSSSTFNSTRIMRKSMRAPVKHGTGKPHRPIKRTKSAMARSLYLRQEVSKPPKILSRSESFPSVNKLIGDKKVNSNTSMDYNPSKIKLRKTNSVPSVNCFDQLMMAKGKKNTNDSWTSAEAIWDEWFYEVLAEVRTAIADLEKGRQPYFTWQLTTSNTENTGMKRQESKQVVKSKSTSKSIKCELPQITEQLELANILRLNGIDYQGCIERIGELTDELELTEDPHTKAEILSERGTLNRKIGNLCEAMADQTKSLSLSTRVPSLHWERHLLLLIQGKHKAALEELTLLLKKDSNHVMGYQSKGALLLKSDRLSDAIHNYTRAIWLEGNNPKLYFIRAELREQKGEIEAAVSDYSMVVSLDSTNEEALMRQALHKFKRKLWGNTVQLLTTLLSINRNKMEAWLLRSQAYLNMDKHEPALQDLSAAIHLNPNSQKLYYQRGCLLRSQYPRSALRDFSIAILLGDRDTSTALAYLHRGVVYTQLKRMHEALSDFKMATSLDSSLSSAYTNAGLIILNHIKKPNEAVNYFTAGMLADPTYIRALLCRAEAYTKMGQYNKAIADWARAIHFSPDNPSYHLNQGKVFLKMKDYSNAFLCIKISSKLEGGVGSSPAQQALVFAFIGDHDKAVSRLQAVLSKGSKNATLFSVLGKVQLRAKMFNDAVTSFTSAINHITFADPFISYSANKAAVIELHYMCGRSLMGAGDFRRAAASFSQVLLRTPNNSWAHYYHGLALLKCGQSKGMISINHALMLNPTLTEAYLTRAAYYGKVGRISKGILNCTEAIKLQPKSSRAYLYRGVLRHMMGYQETALADLSEAISLSPGLSSIALFNRAICYQCIGETEKAIKDYSTMYLMDSGTAHLYQVLINRGLLYLDTGDYANALCDFVQASEIESGDSNLWQSIAYCHHKLGQLSEAITCYTKAIEIDPSFTEAYIGRGNAHTEFLTAEGNMKARIDYECVIQDNPECLAARLNLALLQQCEGKHMLAWQSLSDLLEHHKDYVPGLEARAIISLQNMNTFGSLLDINRAIRLAPTSPQLYVERGVIYQYMKDIYNAVKDFEKAVSIDSNLPIAYYNLGNVLLQQKLYRQAIERYSKVVKLMSEKAGIESNATADEALINRGICHVAVGQYAEALGDFDDAIKANPFAAHAYFNRANLLKRNGDIIAAEEDYRKALSLYPNDPVSLNYHGYTLGLLGNTEESRKQFLKAVEI